MRNFKVAALAAGFVIGLSASAFAGSDGHGTNTPDLGALKPEQAKVDPAVLATGERVADLSDMSNPVR